MKAIVQDLYAKKRQPLHEIIPLAAPLSLSLEPITSCNLKCNFCLHSLPPEERVKHDNVFQKMSKTTYDLLISQLLELPQAVKVAAFAGIGEPLLHEDLPYMIAELKNKKVAEEVSLTTNGTLLSHPLSDSLLRAGLDTVVLSLNGLSREEYLKTCGVEIDFDDFTAQIGYYFRNKGVKQKLALKTFDFVVDTDERERRLYDIFGNICDQIGIERLLPRYTNAEIGGLKGVGEAKSRFSQVNSVPNICSNPFYRAAVLVDGTVRVCGCHSGISVGNIFDTPFAKLWNGEAHRKILANVLKQKYEGITDYCTVCTSKTDFAFKEDNIDAYAEEIFKRIFPQP